MGQVDNYKLYVHIFPDGKLYFGITKQSVAQRWGNGKGYKSQPKVFGAIQLYGWDNIVHEIIEDNLSQEEAIEKEKTLIKKYNTIDCGYNDDEGGGAGGCDWVNIEYNGKVYKSSELEEEAADGITAHDLTTRIGRGWDVERALSQTKQERKYTYNYQGKEYSVEELMQFAKIPITKDQLYGRLWRGWDIDRALTQPTNRKNQPCLNLYEYNGKMYTTKELLEMSEVDGLTIENIRDRIKRGWDIEKVITQKKRKSPTK